MLKALQSAWINVQASLIRASDVSMSFQSQHQQTTLSEPQAQVETREAKVKQLLVAVSG